MSRHLRMNTALVLEDPMLSPDGAGGYLRTWTQLGTLWAEVTPQSPRAVNGRIATRYRIVMRASAEGTPSRPRPEQRLRSGARIFNIDAVTEPPDMPGLLLCTATEEAAT